MASLSPATAPVRSFSAAPSKPTHPPAAVLHLDKSNAFVVLGDGETAEAVAAALVAHAKPNAAYLSYTTLAGGKGIDVTHTFTPESLRGRGLAGLLTARAMAWAGEAGLPSVKASCGYVATWAERGEAGGQWTYHADSRTLIRAA